MTTIKVKTKSGHVQELTFDELLEVNGRAYAQRDESELLERLAHLEGRVSSIETIFGDLIPVEPSEAASVS